MSRQEADASVSAPAEGGTPPNPTEEPQIVSLYERWRKIYPLWVTGGFQTWRRVVLVILVIVYYAGPWLQWNGQPGFQLDLAHRRFTVFWTTFVPEEFVFFAWMLLIAALTLFTVTVFAGRIFCGWACPQTVWSLVYFTVEYLVEGDRNARMRLDKAPWNRRKVARKALKFSAWAIIAFSISVTFLGYFVPIRELLPRIATFDLSGWEQFFLFFPAGASFLFSGVLREQVCFHMCPYARFQSVMFDRDSLIISYDEQRGEPRGKRRRSDVPESLGLGSCIDCRKCVNVCPTGIDIRDGLQYQCIGCAACVDACAGVMETMGYGESLVRYSTQRSDQNEPARWLRPRLVGYASLIVAMVGLFGYALGERLPLSLDVKRDRSRLYREFWDGRVENVYTLRISNRGAAAEEYRIAVDSELPLEYHGARTVQVDPGELEPVPIRLTLPPGSEREEATSVRFVISTLSAPVHRVEKTSQFHVPEPSTPQ